MLEEIIGAFRRALFVTEYVDLGNKPEWFICYENRIATLHVGDRGYDEAVKIVRVWDTKVWFEAIPIFDSTRCTQCGVKFSWRDKGEELCFKMKIMNLI